MLPIPLSLAFSTLSLEFQLGNHVPQASSLWGLVRCLLMLYPLAALSSHSALQNGSRAWGWGSPWVQGSPTPRGCWGTWGLFHLLWHTLIQFWVFSLKVPPREPDWRPHCSSWAQKSKILWLWRMKLSLLAPETSSPQAPIKSISWEGK